MTSNTAETVLITGAGRGLGKALAALYAAKGWRVLCALRDPTHHDGPGEALLLDVADPASIAALGQSLESVPIDLVINNAGIRGDIGGLSTLEPQDFSEVMTVNALAPLLIARALHGNLLAGKRRILANISSRAGSLAEGIVDDDDGDYAYRCSKAALNMATVLLARDFRRDGIAHEDGEVTPGFRSVGVAVRDHVDWPVAAVAVQMLEQMQRQGTPAVEQVDIALFRRQQVALADLVDKRQQRLALACADELRGPHHLRDLGQRLPHLGARIGKQRAEGLEDQHRAALTCPAAGTE